MGLPRHKTSVENIPRTRQPAVMELPIRPPFPAMEALLVDKIPIGAWQYEPKWDGFRCLVFRDSENIFLQSKSGQSLTRYFPELVEAFENLSAERFVVDGEIAVPVGKHFSFDDLLQRIHPAESRVRKLAKEFPALFIAFDLLFEAGESLVELPLMNRRKHLEAFAKKHFGRNQRVHLSPATTDLAVAKKWFKTVGADLDGIIAKELDAPYRSGERSGMQKIKSTRTADCVIGGFRYASKGKVIGSLLLGLYDESGKLNHVGFCSGLKSDERKALVPKLEALIQPPGFTGNAPGGPSRWSTKRSTEWQPLKTKLVIEVSYDHFTGGRFRHGTSLIRWRPDKAPQQCTLEQVARMGKGSMELLR
jgi:ATP-dependent DNA ligase